MVETLEIMKEQAESIEAYRRMGIDIDVVDDVVVVHQRRLLNGYILNQKQLHERAREIFPTEKIHADVFSLDVSQIDEKWILDKMDEFGIKRNDLIKQLALTKSYISLLFADDDNPRKIHLSRQTKAMFYYYFLTYELNRDFREYLNNE
ncbi:hypothetical protein [Cruoricaptor ignavus]|uniref:hypothetical protein n=1 Tax=Cruoricaptor ignavus TaxID=1118202 RepID=UPI001D0BF49D|nr:hypothetical protein [Cruoricaptor ignavus]